MEIKKMSQDEKEFQDLFYLISHMEGYLKLRIIPVSEERLFTFQLRLERIFTCVKEQLSQKKKEN